ncbi:hypothetical protein SAMN04487846_0171 [Microbacterium sp. cf046]|uniref:hypothetical protein n=1 Tax=Microbacterium sp. cf046 TaxID=1761803 RepID=UPI0008EA2B73|nr:hypothetical protein [Microbacterium sp. cf046]SFR87556.1 hypothetical protein SAMN04487846_0171 [Microbacterium sp. cf046]
MPIASMNIASQALEAIESAQRQLGEAVGCLADLSTRAVCVADATDWRTDAAQLFHADADAWRRDVATLSGAVDDARDEVGRLRSRIEAHVWRYGV